MHSYDTIVVGLGCAGVTAASTLAKAGKQVLAIESEASIGGRVKTIVNSNGGVVERGAEWIHGKNNCVYSIAKQHNILVLPQDVARQVFWSDGSVADENSVKIPPFFGIPEIGKTDDVQCDQYSWHRYGYKTFLEIMLNTYNNGPGLPNLDIKLWTSVLQINWLKDNVEVVCTDRKTYTASNVIVTVPLGVLKKIHPTLFNPPLPDKKIKSIENISVGVINKMCLKFNEPWWPKRPSFFYFLWKPEDKAKITKQDSWMTEIFGASSSMGCRNSLTLWVRDGAAETIEKIAENKLRNTCMVLLKKFMGKTCTISQQPWILMNTTWHSQTHGSYSYEYHKPSTARLDLAEPLVDSSGNLRVLFAGEATHSTQFSSTHGASESGFREAKRLVPGLKDEM